MSSADQPPPFDPPEPSTAAERPRLKPQFSMATLLGVLTLVAVLTALAVNLPFVFSIVLDVGFASAIAIYVAVLIAGAYVCTDRKRLFCLAALGTLVLTSWSGSGSGAAFWQVWMVSRSMGSGEFEWMFYVGIAIQVVKSFGVSLLGGWFALVAARYWQPE